MMDSIERIWGRIEDAVMGVLAGCALLLICYEVVVRYFIPSWLTDWGAELTIYFTVWAMLIAGGSLVTSRRHIRADLLVRSLPERLQWLLELVSLIVGFLYCGLIAKFGLDVVAFARMLDERSESSIQFPLWIFYIALPVGFGLMALRYGFRLYRFLFRFDPSMLKDHHEGPETAQDQRSVAESQR